MPGGDSWSFESRADVADERKAPAQLSPINKNSILRSGEVTPFISDHPLLVWTLFWVRRLKWFGFSRPPTLSSKPLVTSAVLKVFSCIFVDDRHRLTGINPFLKLEGTILLLVSTCPKENQNKNRKD